MVVCRAFGLTLSETKTKITCLRMKGMPESTVIFSVEAAGQVYHPTEEFVYLGGIVNHNECRSVLRNQPTHTQCMVQLPEVHPRSVRPTGRSSRAQNQDATLIAEVLETMRYGCVTWTSRACHYDTLRRACYSFLTRFIG